MAQAFNLTAQLNLRGPNNVNKIVSQIKKQLGTINANVNVTINPATTQTVTQLNAALTTLNTTLATTSANANTTAAAVNSLMQAMSAAASTNVNQSLNNASNAVQQLGANANAAAGGGAGGGGGVTQLRTEMEEFGRQSALAVRRFAAFSLVTSTVFALTNAFNQAFKAFIDFDKEFVKLQQVTGESAVRLQTLAGTITQLSTSLGVSSAQLATVSSTLAQAGLSAKDTERALKALALSSLAPSFDDMNQTVEGSIALMRQFGISADQLGAALGSVNAVSAQFAVESSDIIAAIQRTGGVFASASKGVSEGTQALNEFIAVFTSVRATTRESAETIATGLRTIFTRIQRGSTIEALKEFGVTLTDAEGKFVGAYKAVELLSRGLNGIDPRDLKFSQIIEELGGFRQIGKVIPLIQQFGTAQQALAIAQGGQTSLTEDAIVAQLSLANQFAKVREEFVAMVREIGGSDTFQTLAKGALQLASALIQIADSVKGVLPVLAVITAVRGVGAMRQFGRGFAGGMRNGQQNAATGGMIRKYAVGGQVPVALMPGETVVYPDMVNRIGTPKLRQLNHADKKMARGGGVGLVPGKGRTDSFKTTLPVGSFVIRTDATRALGGPDGVMRASGYAMGGDVQNFKRGTSKPIQKKRTAEQRDEEGRTRKQFYADMVSKRKRPTVDEEGRTREEFYADMVSKRKRPKVDEHNRTQEEFYADMLRYAMGGDIQSFKGGTKHPLKKKINPGKVNKSGSVFMHLDPGPEVSGPQSTMKDIFARSSKMKGLSNIGISVGGIGPSLNQEFKDGTATLAKQDFIKLIANTKAQDLFARQLQLAGSKRSGAGTFRGGSKSEAFKILSDPSTQKTLKKALIKEILRPDFPDVIRSDKDQYRLGRALMDQAAKIDSKLASGFGEVRELSYHDPVRYARRIERERKRAAEEGRPEKRVTRDSRSRFTTSLQEQLDSGSIQFQEDELYKGLYRKNGGIIQHFMAGSTKPLKDLSSMGKSDLLREADKLGVLVPMDSRSLLDPRAKGSEKVRADLIQKLEAQRLIKKTKSEKTSEQAKRTKVAVIGSSGPREVIGSSKEVTIPGVKNKAGQSRNLPATLEIGGYPADSKPAKRIKAAIENAMARASLKVAKIAAKEAGIPIDQLDPKILKQLARGSMDPSAFGGIFGAGMGIAANSERILGGADPTSMNTGSADIKKLPKQLAESLKVTPEIPADFTRGAEDLLGVATRKASGVSKKGSKKSPKSSQLGRALSDPEVLKNARRRAFGGIIQKLKAGGMPDAPLIDDIVGNIPGTYPPVPSGGKLMPAIQKIIDAGGGALDFDGTLENHTGDDAYPRAKTPAEKKAVLDKHYLGEENRLQDVRPTKFSIELEKAIKQGLIKPANLSVISMSRRLPIVEQKIMNRFGIPKDNLIFTQGGPKDKAVEALRTKGPRASRVSRAAGGEIPIIAQEGEYVVNRKSAKSFGYNNLAKINKYHSGGVVGKVQKFASGGQPKLDTIGATATGLSPRAFQIFEKTLFRVSSLFNGMGAETLKTTQAMDIIAKASPQLAADILNNGRVHNRTAVAQEAVAVRYASLIQPLQNSNLSQQQLNKITAQYSSTIVADTAAKNFSITQTKSLGSKIASAWNTATGIVSQAASSFAATLGKKSSTATPLPAATPTPVPTAPVPMPMGAPGSIPGMTNSPQAQAQAIAQAQAMSAQAQQAQTQRPSIMGSIGRGMRGMMGGQGNMAMGFALPMLASSLAGGEAGSAQQAENNATLGGVATGAGIGASLAGLPGMLVGAVGGLITGIDAGAKAARQFTINMERNKIEDSGDKLAKTLEEINKKASATPVQLESLNSALKTSIDSAIASGQQSLPKASLSQFLTEIGVAAFGGGETSKPGNVDTRAAIFEKQGFMGLIKAMTGGPEVEQQMFRDIAPMLARETSKGYAVAASQAKSVFEQQFKQGKSIEDLMNGPEWNKQAEVLARSNAAIQEQILLIQNSTALGAEEKKARIDNLIASEAETQARKQFAEVKLAEELKKLQKDINNLSFSFNRMLGNMDAAVQSSVANLAKLDESLSLSSASLSGGAKVGGSSSGVQNTLDVLKNPAGYNETQKNTAFSRAASPFGSQSGNIEKVLKAGSGLESTVLGTINKTLSGSKGETQEAITAKIESALRSQFKDLQLPPALADKLAKQIGEGTSKIRRDGEDTIDYSQLVENVPELSKTIDIFKNTADQASKAMEFNKQAFDRLSEATNQQIDLTVESNARTRNAQNILAKGSMDLNKALGMNVSLGTRRSAIESPIRSMTGGTTDPSAMAMNYNQLEAQRQQLQTSRNQAAAGGDVGAVRAFDNQLAQTNTSLRENIDALKGMADSSELASAALDEIDKAQKRQQAGVGFMEKLVTSTPKELSNMNQAFARLDANMKGIAVGGTNPEQRKQSLEMFQMIAPFLGDQEKGLQANVLQSMLQESGVGISPMLQQVLDGMRNPAADPQQALAIQTYKEATDKQAQANLELARMNTNLANDISTKTGNAVAEAIKNNTISFEKAQLDDLVNRINRVPTEVVPAVGKADGGLIYKAVGGSIFKPKGTDTVPAMLTPGEFVVNRSATQANLPLLKSINNGYSKGGKVKYLASGGIVSNLFDNKDVPKDLTEKGISKTKLPFISPEVIPVEDGDAKLVGLRASVFPKLQTDGIDPGFKKFVDAIKAKTKTVEDSGSDDPDRKGNFFKNIASLGINPENYPVAESVKPVLGLTDNFTFKNDRETMLRAIVSKGDTNNAGILIPKVFPRNAVTANMDSETIMPLPYKYDNISKILSAGSVPNPIGQAYLNDKPPKIGTLIDYGKKTSTDIGNDPRLDEASAQSQLGIITAINTLFDNDKFNTEEMLKDVKKKIIYKTPDTYTPPSKDFPENVKDLYNRGLLYLNSEIPGKFMMPAIAGKNKTIALTRTNSLGATNNNLWGMGNNGYSADEDKAEIKEEFFNKFVTDIAGYKQSLKEAETELKQAIMIKDFFSGTSSKQQKYAGTDEILNQIKSGQFPGVYLPIQNDLLNKEWKEKIGTNPLFIFRNSLPDWKKNIEKALTDDSFPEFKSIRGYDKAGERKEVELDSRIYPWLAGSSVAVERFTQQYYGAQAAEAKENYKSPFDVDMTKPVEYAFDTQIPLKSIQDELGPGNLQAAFAYYPINSMPKLSSADGYARSNNEYKNAVLIKDGLSSSTDPKTIRNLLDQSKRANATLFAETPGEVEQEITRALKDYIDNRAVGVSIQDLKIATPINNQSSPASSWISPTETNAFAINGNTLTPPIQIRDMVESFKNDLLTSASGQATTIPGVNIDPSMIGDKLKTAQQLINQIIGPKIGVIRGFGYGLTPLSVPAQIGQYAEGLMSLSKSFGGRIVGQNGSVNPNLADVWGRITAVGETFKFLAKDDLVGLGNKIGLAQSAMNLTDGTGISSKVAQYAQFLAAQGTFLAGVSGQAQQTLGQQVTGDQQIASTAINTGGGSGKQSQSITDIFKGAKDASLDKEGKIQSKDATPPKTLLELGKKVFNPYSTFANPNDRASLIDYLMSQIKDQVNPYFTSGVNTLRNYLLGMDTLISGATFDEKDLDLNYKGANSALLALTNGEFGALPNVQKIKELAALRAAQQQAQKEKAEQEAKNPGKVAAMATGGVVYASNGTLVNYQPRGTDTVPAMLTPGEFVVNRSATQRNLPLLHAINSGGTQGLNRGGIVNYLQSGGIILPQYHADKPLVGPTNSVVGGGSIKVDGSSAARGLESALTVGTNALKQVLQGFGISTESITAINSFVTGLQKVSEVLANINITPEVKFTGSVDVNVKGTEGLTGPMRDLVNGAINNAMTRLQSANSGAKLEVPQGDFTSGK